MTNKSAVTQTKKDIVAIPLSRSLLIAQQPQTPAKPNSIKDGLSPEELKKVEQATPSVKAKVNTGYS
ncbi:MAG: hypothetical protein PUP90_20585 [Nostoc sp. S4]|nr:hypothetical protein [Nostoc sp. S4]